MLHVPVLLHWGHGSFLGQLPYHPQWHPGGPWAWIHRSLLGAWSHGDPLGPLEPADTGVSPGPGFDGTCREPPKAAELTGCWGRMAGVHSEVTYLLHSPSLVGRVSWLSRPGGRVMGIMWIYLPYHPQCIFSYFHASPRFCNPSPGIFGSCEDFFIHG